MDIAIIGMGRLGRTVSRLLTDKGIPHKTIGKNDSLPKADLHYLLVPDKCIESVATNIDSGIILHASGTYDHLILRPHRPAGVLHPIMSFPGPEVSIPPQPIPASICGDIEAIEAARKLSEMLGFSSFEYSGDRKLYHAAAVLAGNFSTTLIHMAGTLLKNQDLSLSQAIEMLTPLAIQSINQAQKGNLNETLTGPISRQDEDVISGHIKALMQHHPHISNAYESMVNGTVKHINFEKD